MVYLDLVFIILYKNCKTVSLVEQLILCTCPSWNCIPLVDFWQKLTSNWGKVENVWSHYEGNVVVHPRVDVYDRSESKPSNNYKINTYEKRKFLLIYVIIPVNEFPRITNKIFPKHNYNTGIVQIIGLLVGINS